MLLLALVRRADPPTIRLLVSLLALAAGARAAPPKPRRFATPAAALATILDRKTQVVAFGEYHEVGDQGGVPSAIRRFGNEMLDPLAPRLADLVVETWVTKGDCGGTERAVVKEVERATQRPAQTESEIVTLLKRAKERGVRPHVLELSCDEYGALQGEGDTVDYSVLLGTVNRKLREQAEGLLARGIAKGKLIALYGGALHNDLYPEPALAAFTFGQALKRRTGGRYVEVDLYVPEYVERNPQLAKEKWLRLFRAVEQPGKVVLMQRGPGSYLLWFPRMPKPTASPRL